MKNRCTISSNGKQLLLAGQKSGVVYALDPDANGKIVWQSKLGGGFTLRRGSLDTAIEERRNAGAAALEAASYIATALLVSRLG